MAGIDPYDSDERGGPGLWFWAAAIFLSVVIVVAVAVLVIGGGDDDEAASTPSSASKGAESRSDSPEDVTTDACADFPNSPEDATTADAQWTSAGAITFPLSPVSGPASKSSSYGTCFAHSEDGALYAAATAASIQGLSPDDRLKWSREYLVGPAAERAENAIVEGLPSDTPGLRVSGYRITESTSERVVVDLLVTAGDSAIRSLFDMRWNNGEWRVYATDENIPSYPVEDPAGEGFIEW